MPERTFGDPAIRSALRSFVLTKRAYKVDTILIEELGICRGRVRVDLAVVDDLLHGFEIKSDRDSLRRLARQVTYYSRVLDKATIVVGKSHLDEALKVVPIWWGVLLYQPSPKGLNFKMRRRGRKNPQRDPRSLVELLWLDEAIALLEARDVARGVRGKPRRFVWDRVCEYIELDELADTVRAILKGRSMQQAPALP